VPATWKYQTFENKPFTRPFTTSQMEEKVTMKWIEMD
jgi:hypothetical protein